MKAGPPKIVAYLMELRAPFFTASVAPVLVGTALAVRTQGTWDGLLFILALVGTVMVHAGANIINDYFDHINGNDAANTNYVRPFTGGSRLIQNGWMSPGEVLGFSIVCFIIGSAIGIYLTMVVGWPILVLGLIGVAGGFFYTAPVINLTGRGVGELTIAICFGVLPVAGAYFVQTQEFGLPPLIISLPLAVLIAAVLFINQFQDMEADGAVGKRNWVVRLGRQRSVAVYGTMMLAWPLPIVGAVLKDMCPPWCLVALVGLVPAVTAIMVASKHFDSPKRLTPANALTIVTHLVVGLALTVTLALA